MNRTGSLVLDGLVAMFGYAAGLHSAGGPTGAVTALHLKNHIFCKL